jgi:hypothetical protein
LNLTKKYKLLSHQLFEGENMAAPITSTGFIQKKCWYEACDQKENATKRCTRCRQAIY